MKSFGALILCVLATGVIAKELPSYVILCKRSSPMFKNCTKMAANTIQPYLSKGIKELNIPPLEPLVVPMVKLEQGTGAVSYKATIRDMKVYGLTGYKVKDIAFDFSDDVALKVTLDLPRIRLVGEYEITGKILLLPIQGNGEFTANITDCTAQSETKATVVTKKGVQYLQNKDSRLHLKIGGAKVNFANLFNGDAVLSSTTNNFLNENVQDILSEVQPAIEAVAAMLIDDILNKVYKSTAYDKLIPE